MNVKCPLSLQKYQVGSMYIDKNHTDVECTCSCYDLFVLQVTPHNQQVRPKVFITIIDNKRCVRVSHKTKAPPPHPPPKKKNIVAASFSPESSQMQPPSTNLQSSITALNLESIESIMPFLFISLAKNNSTSELHLSQGKENVVQRRERERNLSKHCVEFPSLFTKVCKIQSIEVINLQFVHSYTICSA